MTFAKRSAVALGLGLSLIGGIIGGALAAPVERHDGELPSGHAELRALPGVVHIALVGGEFDVIMLVRARDNAALGRLVLDEIQGMPGVVNTRTLLVFEEAEL